MQRSSTLSWFAAVFDHQRRRFRVPRLLVALNLLVAMCLHVRAERIRHYNPWARSAKHPLHINVAPGGPTYYGPNDIRHAYGMDLIRADGAGQTIAIVVAYGSPFIQQDLDTFCWYFGLPDTRVTIDYPQGQPAFDIGWAEETSLDVEWAHAIAPAARLVLVVANTQSLGDLLNAVDYAANIAGVNVVSMSWGFDEFPEEVTLDAHFEKPGVTFVAASGDSGEQVQWPAVSPNVLSVGGTSLYLDVNGNYLSEAGWSGSGGGISLYEDLPYYQSGWLPASGRGVPDVSYVADSNTGVEVVFADLLFIFGGTSVGAPQWAGLIALSNSLSRSRGLDSNAAIYAIASLDDGYSIDPAYFYDIVSGSNGPDPDDFAAPGYDLVTGLGSPVCRNLLVGLTAMSPPPPARTANSSE